MKKNFKFIASLLAVLMTIMSLGLVSVVAEDTSAPIKELGNISAISTLKYSTNDAFEGSRSLHFTGGGEMTTPTKLGLTKGESYNISFYLKGTLTTSNGMYLRAGWSYTTNAAKIKSNADGVFSVIAGAGDGILSATAVGDGWYKMESTVPWKVAEMSIGFFNVQTGGGTVDFYMDNLSITDANGKEMVYNGGFEETTDIITEFGNESAVEGLSYSDTVGYDDTSSIRVRTLHADETQVNIAKAKGLKVENGKEYNFSFYTKGVFGTNKGMYIRLGWTNNVNAAQITSDANGVITASIGADVLSVEDAGDGWYKVSTITPWVCGDAGIDFFKVMSGSKVTDFYIDNFEFEEYVESNTDIITELGNTTVIEGLSYSDTVGYDDSSSIHVTTSVETPIATTAGLGLSAGKKYNFEFYVKGDLSSGNGLYVRTGWNGYAKSEAQLKSTNGVVIANQGTNIKVEDAGNGWYKVSSVKAWPCTSSINFMTVAGGAKDFYIDNLSITEQQDVVTELGNTEYIAGLSYDDFTGFDDEKSIKVKVSAQTDIAKAAKLGAENGKYYNFSFYVKGTLTSTNGMYVGLGWDYNLNYIKLKSDADGVFSVGEAVGGKLVTITDAGNGWYKVESAIPWKCTDASMNFMRVTSAGGTANFLIDNLEISEVEVLDVPRSEIIKEIGNTEAVAGLTYSTSVAKDGESSLNIHTATEGKITTPEKLGMKAGESYNFSFYIKGLLTSSNGMYIRTGWVSYDSDQAKIKSDANGVFSVAAGTNLSVTDAGDGWYKVESINPWTVGDAGIGFWHLTVAGAPAGGPDFYIDNLSVTDANGNEIIKNGSFEAPSFDTTDFELIDNGNGNYTVNVLVKNYSEGADFTAQLILATHKDKVMQTIAMDETATTITEGNTLRLTKDITVAEGETMTAFLWDSVSGMTPLRPSSVLVAAE